MSPIDHIKHPALYWAVYARMRDAIRYVVVWKPAQATPVFRAVRQSGADPVETGAKGARKYRTVWKSTVNDYRWTGPRPPTPTHVPAELTRIAATRPAAGGLNTALSLNDAALGEYTWYDTEGSGRRTTLDKDAGRRAAGKAPALDAASFQAGLARSRFFEYRVPAGTPLADLSLGSSAGRTLLHALIQDVDGAARHYGAAEMERLQAVQRALAKAGYVTPEAAYTASDDYSLCRALGQSVRDLLPGCRGLRVTSVRSDAGKVFWEVSGDNLILFGADGAELTDLIPVQELAFEPQPHGPMRTIRTPFAAL